MPHWLTTFGLGVLALVAVALVVLAFSPPATAPVGAASQPPITAPPTATPTPHLSVTFLGDSYTGGSSNDSGANARWPALVSLPSGAARQVLAIGGAGYVATSSQGGPFSVMQSQVNADADYVVIWASRNDTTDVVSVRNAAEKLYSAIQTTAPNAQLIVISPVWLSSDVPQNIINNRIATKAAAKAAGATYVDALKSNWMEDLPDLIGKDGVHPNDAGHAYLAKKIGAALTKIIAG